MALTPASPSLRQNRPTGHDDSIGRTDLSPAMQKALAALAEDAERVFGSRGVRLAVVHAAHRELSEVVKVSVSGAAGIEAVFVKVLKPKHGGPSGVADTRGRILREFESMARLEGALASSPVFGVARPLVCFPEQLAIVTAEAPGETLSAVLERRATWWLPAARQDELRRTLSAVGAWLEAVGRIADGEGPFRLDGMRDYIDVRLRRLLETNPPVLDHDGRARILRYFDRTAALVDAADLRQVFTHADLAPSNVIVDGERITVIDFSTAAPGGVFMDVARLYTQLEFLMAKPKFRAAVVRELQAALLRGFDAGVQPDRPLFRLFLLQHLLCHMSNLARNPAPLLSRVYNRHQLLLRQRWLRTFAA